MSSLESHGGQIDVHPAEMIDLSSTRPAQGPNQGPEPPTESAIPSTPQPNTPEPNSPRVVTSPAVYIPLEIENYKARGLPPLNFKPTLLKS